MQQQKTVIEYTLYPGVAANVNGKQYELQHYGG